jgi:hypothetical protein
MAQQLASQPQPPESRLAFERARENFYAAACAGLAAEIMWLDGAVVSVRRLLLEELLPMARRGLAALGIDAEDIAHYLGVIEARVERGRNGAHWQRSYVAKHGADMRALTIAYLRCLKSGAPVHEWEI